MFLFVDFFDFIATRDNSNNTNQISNEKKNMLKKAVYVHFKSNGGGITASHRTDRMVN